MEQNKRNLLFLNASLIFSWIIYGLGIQIQVNTIVFVISSILLLGLATISCLKQYSITKYKIYLLQAFVVIASIIIQIILQW